MRYLDERDCCYRCVGCGLRTCADEAPSPGELDSLCADCWLLDDPEAVAS